VIGDYSFSAPLAPGIGWSFGHGHLTMVKNNTFNGMPLPAICLGSNPRCRRPVLRVRGFQGRLS
jgi:carboxynorspermidine decarboxylase